MSNSMSLSNVIMKIRSELLIAHEQASEKDEDTAMELTEGQIELSFKAINKDGGGVDLTVGGFGVNLNGGATLSNEDEQAQKLTLKFVISGPVSNLSA